MIRPLAIFASCLLAIPAAAEIVVLDYEDADAADFSTGTYSEDGIDTVVESGHYEILADGSPVVGDDRAFNVDEQQLGLTQVRLSSAEGRLFDVLSLYVVNPASSPGEYSISAIGGGGGSIPAPTIAGPLALGPGFQDVSALVITQHAPGAFAMDDVTLNMPEPTGASSWIAPALAVFALARRRSG